MITLLQPLPVGEIMDHPYEVPLVAKSYRLYQLSVPNIYIKAILQRISSNNKTL
jgi:hypothetical protein